MPRSMTSRALLRILVAIGCVGATLEAVSRRGQVPRELRVTAQEPLRLTIPAWIEPTPKRFGVVTFMPPDRPSEVVRVSVPIGQLTMRAAHAIGQAQYRRSEQKARKEVEQALKALQTPR